MRIIGLWIGLSIFSLAEAQQGISFKQTSVENITYKTKEMNVAVATPDSTSDEHFYVTITYQNQDYDRFRFISKNQKKIDLRELEALQKKGKISTDGIQVSQRGTKRREINYTNGNKEGASLYYRNDSLYYTSFFRNSKLYREEFLFPDGTISATVEDVELEAPYSQQNNTKEKGQLVTEYYENRQVKRNELYNRRWEILSQKHYTPEGRDTCFALPFRRKASFPGGEMELRTFLNLALKYPPEAVQNKTEGRVVLRFTVGKDGSISRIKTLKSLSKETDQEAIRIVKLMPKWIPATNMGEISNDTYSLPIRFSLGKSTGAKTEKDDTWGNW